MRRFCLIASLCLVHGLLYPTVGLAKEAESIEEIVVTAEFRDSAASDLPASVTVLRPGQRGDTVNHLEEVLGQIPNLNFASGASRGRFYQIRGIGERSQFREPLNSSVGLIVDGVDLSGIGSVATLYDVQQVEVLRGPQGTLYGANALAGLINIVTPPPSADHTGRLRLSAGDYDAFGVGATVSGPLSESLGYRLSAHRYSDDGFMDNEFLGRDDTNDRSELTVRAKFLWTGENRDWRLSLAHLDMDNGYDAFSLDNDRNTRSDQPGEDAQLTRYAALSMVQDLSWGGSFQASAALASSEIDYGYDEDWTFDGFDPIGYTSTDLYQRDRDTQTLEFRWLSDRGQTWEWVSGVFALRQDVDFDRTYTFDTPFASEYQTERVAIYAEVSRALAQDWRLTLGARVERHGAEYDDSNGVSFDPDDDHFGARIRLEKTMRNGDLFYAGVTQGYKTGGFNQDGSLPANLREFDEETLWNVEVGYKGEFFDERLRLNAAVFRMQRDDIQLQTSRTIPVPGSPVGDFVVFRGNAAEGFNQGLEIESEFFVNERVTLFANIGWLDTEYDRFIDVNGNIVSGREQAHAPEYQFFLGAEFDFSDRWSARIELEGKDEFFFSDSHDTRSDAYELLNASVRYSGERFTAKLWGRNLTDEDYFVRGFFFGNDPRDFYTARPFTQLGEPSRVGLSISVSL